SPAAATFVGIAFHVCNGVGLGIPFTMLFGGRGWKAGVAYACVLELVMIALYPGWLRIDAPGEFTTVSQLGKKLDKDQVRRVHDAISGENLGYHEIIETIVAMFGG
ncbi:MAG: hypothetical protein M3326_02225, partial [Actinomycetota bacterium]|nr:hypothetical protein [Actinomycetota bacterium]